jgi:hypothetical protein
MDRVALKFDSHEEAARADREYYLSLTPEQRVDIVLELVARQGDQTGATRKGLERVCRIVKLSES